MLELLGAAILGDTIAESIKKSGMHRERAMKQENKQFKKVVDRVL